MFAALYGTGVPPGGRALVSVVAGMGAWPVARKARACRLDRDRAARASGCLPVAVWRTRELPSLSRARSAEDVIAAPHDDRRVRPYESTPRRPRYRRASAVSPTFAATSCNHRPSCTACSAARSWLSWRRARRTESAVARRSRIWANRPRCVSASRLTDRDACSHRD
jgi:hypothetical protein